MMHSQETKRKKTFPLEIEEKLHKALKFKALECDMTLHAYIIDTLNARVHENSSSYSPQNASDTSRSREES